MKLTDQMVSRLASSVREPWADRFEILNEAGAGGMGIVYRAKDRETGREVALKVLGLGASHERFAREAEVLGRLDHPAIVDYVAHGKVADGDPWLAMEWLEGVSLSARLRQDPPLSLREAVAIGRQTADALAAAHDKGVIHRDLKPSNLFLVGGDALKVKVLDFGVARIPTERDGAELTETGQVLGTPGYMSPEQVRGAKDVDGRADLFSLGCVLYRMLAGRPAFAGDDVLSVLAKLAMDSPPDLTEIIPDAPRELTVLVDRLMAKDPAFRPVSAAAAARDLEAVEASLEKDGSGERRVASRPPARPDRGVDPNAATVASPPPRGANEEPAPASTLPSTTEWRAEVRKPGKRIAVLIGAGVVALSAAVAFAMMWATSPDEPPPSNAAPSSSATASSERLPSAMAPVPITTAAPEDIRAEIQSAAARACRAWSTSLARGQKSDGSFAMEPHR
ncbi:MAG: protein kinase, partial [Polyangiaceae bacterium]|nr:protein kinase [Polyangiaceae bacterium]